MSTKLCINCRWHRERECFSPQNPRIIDPVDGTERRRFETCTAHRNPEITHFKELGLCGADARWFEPITLPAGEKGRGASEVAQQPANVGGKAQAEYAHETLSALRRVSQLDARLDPTPAELQEMLNNVNAQE